MFMEYSLKVLQTTKDKNNVVFFLCQRVPIINKLVQKFCKILNGAVICI